MIQSSKLSKQDYIQLVTLNKKLSNSPFMFKLNLLLLLLLVVATMSLIPLKADKIEKNYAIGEIDYLRFMDENELFFQCSSSKMFGFLKIGSGDIESVYQIEPFENIIHEEQSKSQILIGKGKFLNSFVPKLKQYMRMHESQLLQTHQYSHIVAFLRAPKGQSYILTDQFLSRNIPQPLLDGRMDFQFQKLLTQDTDQPETYYDLITLFDNQLLKAVQVMISLVQQKDSVKICFRKLTESSIGEKKCEEVPSGEKLQDIVASFAYLYIQFQNSALVFNATLDKVGELDERPQQYTYHSVIVGKNHKSFIPYKNTVYSYRIIDQDSKMIEMTMTISQKQFLIEVATKDLVTIKRNNQENPKRVWAKMNLKDTTKHQMIIEFTDDRLVFYEINEQKHTSRIVWEKDLTPAETTEKDLTLPELKETNKDIEINSP